MSLTTLPYPNMDFEPMQTLTADELDHMVANIQAVNEATINGSNIANNSITNAKLSLQSEDFSSKVTFADTPSGADFRKTGNLVTFTFQGASKTHAANAVAFTLPTGYRPTSMGVGSEQKYFVSSARYNETPVRGYINIANGQFIVETADSSAKRLYVSGCFFTD